MKTYLKQILKFIYILIHKNIVLRKINVSIGPRADYSRNTIFEGNNHISTNSKLINSYIGKASYVSTDCFIINTKVGKFSSIGPDLKCILGKHPTNTYVSTHPCFFSLRKQSGFTYVSEQRFEEFAPPIAPESNYTIAIGNDVWIGARVTILDGIKIGDGAIVASGSLVNKDIPPYTIVGGVPARPIRKRFSEEEINFLLDFQWWHKGDEWIKKNSHLFCNIQEFMVKNSIK